MRQLLSSLATAILLALPITAGAQERPVVVELFTSQGCSSCPPADALLHELAERDGVIALAMHVDYWDYIGWKDSFASPETTQRQRDYARAGNRRMVYTPQMIINGSDHVVGNRPRDVDDLLAKHSKLKPVMALKASRSGDTVVIKATPQAGLKGPVVVQLVRFTPKQSVDIKRGENAGRTISYANVVSDVTVLETWDGRDALEVSADMAGSERGAVLVQRTGNGPVVAASLVE